MEHSRNEQSQNGRGMTSSLAAREWLVGLVICAAVAVVLLGAMLTSSATAGPVVSGVQTADGVRGVPDCDSDGTPDSGENDCDTNGTPDDCDTDCNTNGTPDGCERFGEGAGNTDCNSNGTPDSCELTDNDCNSNVTPDDCDEDANSDGAPDGCDLCPEDAEKDGPGECGCGIADQDTDGDDTADCNDDCPDDVNKTSAGECGCNEADEDTDGDELVDCPSTGGGGGIPFVDCSSESLPQFWMIVCDLCGNGTAMIIPFIFTGVLGFKLVGRRRRRISRR